MSEDKFMCVKVCVRECVRITYIVFDFLNVNTSKRLHHIVATSH